MSTFGWTGISFSKPVIKESVEKLFSIYPETHGITFWQCDTFWFRPIQAYKPNIEYQARLTGDLRTIEGEIITVDRTWSFTVRAPDLVYFVPAEVGGEIWRASADGLHAQQLSFTQNKVVEFSVERSGTAIAFTVQNDRQGHDLWMMDRIGQDQERLLDCGRDICGEPAWSMDGQTIAYSRQVYLSALEGYQGTQVWTVDLESGQTAQLYQSEPAFGHSPSFSPDGKHIASYDTINKGIRILDLATSQESILTRALSGSGDWSQDGTRLIFTDLVAAENEPFVQVYVLDLETNAVDTVLDVGLSDTDFSQPRWSPDGESVAVSLRPVNSNISKTLWVLRLDGSVSRQVADDPSATFSAYAWHPWGDRLVYQRYDLGNATSSIWLWEDGKRKQIIEHGSRPQWLP
jgi:Tol biopolymer transport system component